MQIEGWRYYNHAAIPTSAPHEPVNLKPIDDNSIWNIGNGKKALLARWHTDWDCGYETPFWFVIKDYPFDISLLKSKRRYEIKKGKKNFRVKKIEPEQYVDDLLRITLAAYSAWPKKYRPMVDQKKFRSSIGEWNKYDVFGAFNFESGELCGYAHLTDRISFVEFSVLRVDPMYERFAINAAIIAGILEYYKERFDGHFYINDGSRAIRHETAFQDYLEKYFGFRKAYCKLSIKYKNSIGVIVKILYPYRKHIKGRTGIGNQISGILMMEEIRREC